MDDKIQSYRQPMVTATGILLGFILNFAISWVPYPSSITRLRDVVSLFSLTGSVVLLLIVLYRILNMRYPREKTEIYYQKTLWLFIAGLACVFLGIFIVMIYSFL
ncbi:MAG TPA: hypothetical protein PKE63_11855 [Lacibacter sp.]|nr:hypothetical protein [Lacibacter sp.]HMO88395.1 hypothetical protein [Lacibacter sp.]HMP87963.1 hypothetical protein [Lacibacter sp.]